jgi:hypothetical protein
MPNGGGGCQPGILTPFPQLADLLAYDEDDHTYHGIYLIEHEENEKGDKCENGRRSNDVIPQIHCLTSD